MYRLVTISKNSIESIVKKDDAVLFYMKSGKCWVCEKIIKRESKTITLELKGKCDK